MKKIGKVSILHNFQKLFCAVFTTLYNNKYVRLLWTFPLICLCVMDALYSPLGGVLSGFYHNRSNYKGNLCKCHNDDFPYFNSDDIRTYTYIIRTYLIYKLGNHWDSRDTRIIINMNIQLNFVYYKNSDMIDMI